MLLKILIESKTFIQQQQQQQQQQKEFSGGSKD